jgi:hypothetical protein
MLAAVFMLLVAIGVGVAFFLRRRRLRRFMTSLDDDIDDHRDGPDERFSAR